MRENGRPTVLVVEDDRLVRETMADVLRDAGFATCEAGCADDALRALAEHPVDAVVTDIDMPGEIDGIGLARRMGELWPEIGVLVISGGKRALLPPAARFLAKPFTAGRLLAALAEVFTAAVFATS